MELDRQTCDRARRARDPRFDGRFFIAVTSTHIYCRPICPARTSKDENVRYYPSAAAAQVAGFRPCLRCRPEAAPGTPAWHGTSGLVSRALRLIHEGALDESGVEELAERLGITGRHLRRLFLQNLGATPRDVAITRRLHFAKKLIDETDLAMADVAFAAGFKSLRRFNSQLKSTYTRTPTELRRLAHQHAVAEPERYRFKLSFRPPYEWDALLSFLAARAIPGVEEVVDGRYRRTIRLDGNVGVLEVARDGAESLRLEVRFPDSRGLLTIVERARGMFDLAADPEVVAEHLRTDGLLAPLVDRHPGIRVPGAWDGFEVVVREIASSEAAGRIAAMFGAPVHDDGGLSRLFPEPRHLADAALELAGIEHEMAETLRRTARLLDGSDLASALPAITALAGVGPACAGRVGMRALGEPDAYPPGDPTLALAARRLGVEDVDARAESWRPWRAYAAMLLWQAPDDGRVERLASETHHVSRGR
jgi:AraC family transcriptional regulator of adaptative response / DNA-3-methyladenine glycosylase II